MANAKQHPPPGAAGGMQYPWIYYKSRRKLTQVMEEKPQRKQGESHEDLGDDCSRQNRSQCKGPEAVQLVWSRIARRPMWVEWREQGREWEQTLSGMGAGSDHIERCGWGADPIRIMVFTEYHETHLKNSEHRNDRICLQLKGTCREDNLCKTFSIVLNTCYCIIAFIIRNGIPR